MRDVQRALAIEEIMFCNLADESKNKKTKKQEESINVVLHAVMVCKLQGWKEPAVVRE